MAGAPAPLERILAATRVYADGTEGPRLEEVYRQNAAGEWLLHALRDGGGATQSATTRREIVVRREDQFRPGDQFRIVGFKDEHGGVWTFQYKGDDPRIWRIYDPNNDPSVATNTTPECVETNFDGMYGVSTQTTGVCLPGATPRTTVAYVNLWDAPNHEFRILHNAGRVDQRAEVLFRNDDGQMVKRCAANATSKCSTFEYDARGSLTAAVDPDGVRTEFLKSTDDWLMGRIEDPNGARIVTTYERNSVGMPTLVGEVGKVPTTFTYDARYKGLLTSVTTGAPSARRTTTYMRNERGQVIRTTHPDGRVDTSDPLMWGEARPSEAFVDVNGLHLSAGQVTRDWLGQVIGSKDGRGRTQVMTYGPGGRLTETTLADGPTTNYEYDFLGNPTRVTSVAGTEKRERQTRYVMTGHDAQYKPSQIVDALGSVTKLAYDGYGELASIRDAEGRTTTFARTYGADGLLTVTKTDGAGAVSTSVFSAARRLLSTTDARGVKTVSSYDSAGRPVSVRTGAAAVDGKPAVSEELRIQYDARGRVARVTDAARRTSDSVYDSQDRLVQSKDAAGRTVDRTYDDNGKLLFETVAGGAQRSEWSYDANDRLSSTRVFQSGQLVSESTFTYDSLGRTLTISTFANGERHSITREYDNASSDPYALRRELDDRGRETLYTYDALGALASVVRSAVEPLSYARNAWGEPVLERRGASFVSRSFDPLGRLIALSEGGKTEFRTFDRAGLLKTETDFAGKTTSFAYDAAGRLVSKHLPDDTITFAYLPNGLLSSLSNLDGTTSYDYDAANRLVSRSRRSATTSYALAPGGLLSRISQATPLGTHFSNLSRDLVGNLNALSTDARNALSWRRDSLDRIIAYDYDAVWKSSLSRTAGELTGSRHDSKLSFSFETSLTRKHGQLSKRSFTWGFPDDNRAQVELESFSYDPLNDQLAQSTYDFDESPVPGAPHAGLSLLTSHPTDSRGNLTLSPDGLSPLPIAPSTDQLAGSDFVTDAAGNLTHVSLPSEQSWDFAYDAAHRLVRSLHKGFTTRYTYDGAGNLSSQSLTHPDGTIESTSFVVDETGPYPRIAAELRSDGTEIHYVYGPTGLAMRRILKAGAPEDQQYALLDHLGSVRAWSSRDGVPHNWLRFDAFGVLSSNTGAAAPARTLTLVASSRNAGRTASATWGRPFRFAPPPVVLVNPAASGESPALELLLIDGSHASCSYAASSPDGSLKRPLVACTDASGRPLRSNVDLRFIELKPLASAPDTDVRVDLAELLPNGRPAPEPSGLGFTGEWTGPDGTVFLRARHYLPAIGRFLQRDSFAGLDSDSLSRNRYAYARNQPLDLVDPSGHFPKAWGAYKSFERGANNYGFDAFFGLGPALVNGAVMSKNGWELLLRSMAETVTGDDHISGWQPTALPLTPLTADALGLVNHNDAAESLGYNSVMTADIVIGLFFGGHGLVSWTRAEVAALRESSALAPQLQMIESRMVSLKGPLPPWVRALTDEEVLSITGKGNPFPNARDLPGSLSDATFNANNGRSRLQNARTEGLTHVPAEIEGKKGVYLVPVNSIFADGAPTRPKTTSKEAVIKALNEDPIYLTRRPY